MPPRAIADRLCEVFRTVIQNYTPLFVWPLFLEEKYERAFAEPIWEEDSTIVKSVFCIVQMMLAVASQMAEDTEELTNVSGRGDTRERSVLSVRIPHSEPCANATIRAGWKFFHWARKYADLNSPRYTADDAMCRAFQLTRTVYPSDVPRRSSIDVHISGQCIPAVTLLDGNGIHGAGMSRCCA